MKNSLFVAVFLLWTILGFGQADVPAAIKMPENIKTAFDWNANKDFARAVSEQLVLDDAALLELKTKTKPAAWPVGLKTPASIRANASVIKRYKAYKMAEYKDLVLLEIPVSENAHMPANMRPADGSIWLVINHQGIGESYPPRTGVAKPEFYTFVANLTKLEDLKADMKMSDYPKLLSDPESYYYKRTRLVELASRLGIEANWPESINTSEKRKNREAEMRKYVTYVVSMFADSNDDSFVLLWVPKEANKHMPADMQPTDPNGLFFITTIFGYNMEDAPKALSLPSAHLKQ